ncbi:unnamed protein product [Choristocarpus tenellus]
MVGIWTFAHVWSLFLPSMFSGYSNRIHGGPFAFPFQASITLENKGNVNVSGMVANWGYDDVWRICWMTLMFCVLFPLSRSAWALRANFSLAMWLHMLLGAGYFIDNVRRRTHPHVWILNTPFVVWYIIDRVWCATSYRLTQKATCITLDENYMLMLWKQTTIPKRICDIYWLRSDSRSKQHRRWGEMPHPFTTCSSHMPTTIEGAQPSPDTHTTYADGELPPKKLETQGKMPIELPITTDVSWPGHRFSLTSAFCERRRAHKLCKQRSRRLGSGTSFSGQNLKGLGLKSLEDFIEEQEEPEDTMIGADAFGDTNEIKFMVGTPRADTKPFSQNTRNVCVENLLVLYVVDIDYSHSFLGNQSVFSTDGVDIDLKRLVRTSTRTFFNQREIELKNSRLERQPSLDGSWDIMAIVRIQRRKDVEFRCCTCLGRTHQYRGFRQPETAKIPDEEVLLLNKSSAEVSVSTYGPYRSEYGRLTEFPNLPPLLVIGTGAGAGLVLDFIAFVKANGLVPNHPVTICYSAASLPLLQFVTNTLLAERNPYFTIRTAFTQHEDIQFCDTRNPNNAGQLVMGRLNIEEIIKDAESSTELYFCGAGGINRFLRDQCAVRCMRYTGSAVQ